jgi:cytochrome P450
LSNIFFHLARHPEAWRKLRQQVLELPEITTENVKRLNYLQYIINETFRVNPPVSNMTRIAIRDTVLPTGGGPDKTAPVYVPKGTVVGCSFHNLHRRSDIYADDDGDTESWRPERWEKLKLPQLAWKFMPFGGGTHICPAQILAFNRVAFTVARLVGAFERIENRDPVKEFVPAYKLVTASQNGVKVALYA